MRSVRQGTDLFRLDSASPNAGAELADTSRFSRSLLATPAVLLAMACGCSSGTGVPPTPPSDVASTNMRRREYGIREIKPAWIFDRRVAGAEDWLERAGAPSGKRVQRGADSQ